MSSPSSRAAMSPGGVEVEAPAEFFLPSSPDSLLAKFQKWGFFVKPKGQIYRDCIIVFALLFVPLSFGKTGMDFLIGLFLLSFAYILYYCITESIIQRIIAAIIILPICMGISAVFPPFAIVTVLVAIGLIAMKIRSIVMLFPWMLLGILYFLLLASQPVGFKFVAFCALLAIAIGSRDPLKHALFNLSVVFGTVPVLLLILAGLDDMAGEDTDLDGDFVPPPGGLLSIDENGIMRVQYPDGTTLTRIQSDQMADHWRSYPPNG